MNDHLGPVDVLGRSTAPHPLEPLAVEEVETVRDVLVAAGIIHDASVVSTMTLLEPPKADVLAWPDVRPRRRAEVAVVDRSKGRSYEAVVDLEEKAVINLADLGNRQPSLAERDFYTAVVTTKADARWQAAIRARGIEDLAQVQVDPWPTGDFVHAAFAGRRLVRCISFLRQAPVDNGYARPIQGVIAIVDVNEGKVIEVEDHGVVPLPAHGGNYDVPADGAGFRQDLRPISITQPEGPSFEVDGHHVRWQNWELRVSVHPIEGLTLHDVGYNDRGTVRSILYRASLAEMVVPYGDPEASFYWRNAFDAGEVGLGKSVNALQLGCDCLGEIRYFDAVGVDAGGNPTVRPNAICMHEEDYGLLWKHTDVHTSTTHARRSRRLVISSIYTLGNYDYGVFWYFYQDGTIQLEMKLTGIVATKAIRSGDPTPHSVEVAPGLTAPHHQHLFCFRLDFDIDGVDNTVYEVDVIPSDEAANPWGNAFEVIRTPIRSEATSGRVADASRARTWHVVNEGHCNWLGQPVGYRLEPNASATLLAAPTSSVGQRAEFATKHLWVTRNDTSQTRPAGKFPNQSTGTADGIGRWVKADRPLEGTDAVLWHTFGPTHIARPEEWPIMPVEYAGFTLRPVGFFDRNPALDVPPSEGAGCHASSVAINNCHQPSED